MRTALSAFVARALLAELLVAGASVSSYAIACRLLPRETTLLRWTGVIACGAFLASVGFHVLSALGAFAALPAAGGMVALTTGVLAAAGGKKTLRDWLCRDARWLRRLRRCWLRSRYRGLVIASTIAAAPIVIRALVLTPLGWDALVYHGVKAGMWVQHASALDLDDAPGPWAHYRLLWGGGEVFTAWAMLPFRSDLLAASVDGAEWLALGLVLMSLARQLRIREPFASSVVGVTMAMPSIRVLVGSGYVDIAQLMCGIASIALAARFLQSPSPGALWTSLAAAGVAVGIKISFAPLAAIIAAALLAKLLANASPVRARLSSVALAICLFGVNVLPWMWRTYERSGLPLYPLEFRRFGGPLGASTPELEWYRDYPAISLSSELGLFGRGLFTEMQSPGAPIVGLVFASVVTLAALYRRNGAATLLVAAIALANWAGYFSRSLFPVRLNFPAASLRFVLPALSLSVVASGGWGVWAAAARRLYSLFLWATLFFWLLRWMPFGLSHQCIGALVIVLLLFSIAFGVVRSIFRRTERIVVRSIAVGGTVVLFLAALDAVHGRIRADLWRYELTNHDIERYYVDAALAVDGSNRSHRIAMTSGPDRRLDNWFPSQFMGRDLQNEVLYVPVSGDGTVHHFGGGNLIADYVRTADYISWRNRLRSMHVTEVMSFRPPSLELRWMERNPSEFLRITGREGSWGLFAVRDSERAG